MQRFLYTASRGLRCAHKDAFRYADDDAGDAPPRRLVSRRARALFDVERFRCLERDYIYRDDAFIIRIILRALIASRLSDEASRSPVSRRSRITRGDAPFPSRRDMPPRSHDIVSR